MEVGTNDDFVDEIDDSIDDESQIESEEQDPSEQEFDNSDDSDNLEPTDNENEDFLTSLLKSRGIEDKSKIKFENEDGVVEEVDWENLSDKDKLNVLKSTDDSAERELDESEIQLINAIRNSGMNPAEYLSYIEEGAMQRYVQNSQQPQFEIDLYSDDELFLMDFISRTGDVTDEEASEALARAKSNEPLFRKLIEAIRNEYKQTEYENQMLALLEQQQLAQQQYDLFSELIVDEINNLTNIQGFDLNMEDEDMQTLYDFITGQDAAGNNYLAKALSDPRVLVKTAWLALNGDQMISDITNYFQKEIANVRKESYKKGVEDTKNKSNNVVFKEKSRRLNFSDLDDF